MSITKTGALQYLLEEGDKSGIWKLLYEKHHEYANPTDCYGNPNQIDYYGDGALHWLCNSYRLKKFSIEDVGIIIYWLIDRNACVKHKNNRGMTPHDVAVELGDVTLAELIATGGVRKDC